MSNTIQIKCVMDSEFCKGNTWYQIRSMSDHVVYVYLDKYEFVGLPKCHFDMDNIRELKENKMQEKVTLKVGDMLEGESLLGGKKLIITSFGYDRINVACGNFWNYPLLSEKYYVNGKLYARENIIVPDFKEENKMEYQEITPENIAEVLKFNGIDKKLYTVQAKHIDCYTKCGNYCDIFNFNNQLWLQLVEVHFGKLKPLPKANPFDVVKVGDWVRSKKTLYHYQCQLPYRTKDKWYQRIELNNKKCFVCNSNGSGYSSSDSPCDWDLTDIRDYNPTECVLKIGDEIHFYNDLKYSITEINHIESKFYLGESKSITFYFGENHKIKSVNGKKYDTIIIPKFDFAQCLVDAGFKIADDCLYVGKSFDDALIWFNSSTGRLNVGMYIKPTPANAQIIVSMANLAKGIK